MTGNASNRKTRIIDDEDEGEAKQFEKIKNLEIEKVQKSSGEAKKEKNEKNEKKTIPSTKITNSHAICDSPVKKVNKPDGSKSLIERINQIKKEKESIYNSQSNKLNNKQSTKNHSDVKKKVTNNDVSSIYYIYNKLIVLKQKNTKKRITTA